MNIIFHFFLVKNTADIFILIHRSSFLQGFAFASDVGDMSAHIADFVSYCKAAPPLSFMRDGQREKLEERDDASKDNTSSASGALRGSSSISSVGQGQGRHQNGRTLRMCLEDLNRFQKLCTLPSSSRPST